MIFFSILEINHFQSHRNEPINRNLFEQDRVKSQSISFVESDSNFRILDTYLQSVLTKKRIFIV